MNYMKQIAQMLGVELEEEFYLKSTLNGKYLSSGKNKTTFKLSESGVKYKFIRNTNNYEWCRLDAILAEVLTGSLEIVKKPWKPQDNEEYYCVNADKSIDTFHFDISSAWDLISYSLGNCFRTKEEITPEVMEETWRRCYGAYFQDDKQDGAQQ